tara:strand:- start:325 stop:1590 length:1266 start_codon:yes stop_codon:yes gene_type:complete
MAIKDLLLKLRLQGAKKTKEDLKGVDSSIGKIGKTAVKVGAAFFAARGLITGFQKMIELSGEFAKVEQGFNNLAKAQGFSAQTLDKLRQATDGTMTSLELMQQANNAMLLGIFDSEDQMAKMFDAAQRLSSALGQTTTFGIESLVTGLGRQSKLMLDNLGIMIDVEKANKDYAQALGISSRQLTDQQRKQAFVNAAMQSATGLVSQLGDEQLSLADNILQMKVSIDEATIALGETFGPMVTTIAKGVRFLAKEFQRLVDLVNKFTGKGEKEEAPPMEKFKKDVEGSQNVLKLTANEAERVAKFSAQMSTSLATSAIMGDNVAEAFKRMLMQQVLITAQMKIQKRLQESIGAIEAVAGGPAGFLIKGLKFLFGASPTQASPSPNITINQTIQGGMIDHNFAANSIIPAINKAISTGQARINR